MRDFVIAHGMFARLHNCHPTVSAFNLLLATAESSAGRIIFAGSLEEPDETNLVPCSPYAATKGAASAYARMFHALYQTEVVIARISMAYGPGQTDYTKLVPYATVALLRGEKPRLSSGHRLIDWIYVDDVVDGLISAQSREANGQTIELVSGDVCSIRDIVQQLRELIPGSPEPVFGAWPDRPFERLGKANVTKSLDLIGWRPATELVVR